MVFSKFVPGPLGLPKQVVLGCFEPFFSLFPKSLEEGVNNLSQMAQKAIVKLLWVCMIFMEGAIRIGTNLGDEQTPWGTV